MDGRDTTQTMMKEWIAQRTEELLRQRPWHVSELTLVIHDELKPLVAEGVRNYTQPLLATGHLRPDRDMRLKPNT